MTNAKSTGGNLLAHVQSQIVAIQKPGLLPATFSMPVGGVQYDAANLATKLQGAVAPLVDVANLKAALAKAEAAAEAAIAAARALSQQVDSGFKAAFGLTSPTLTELDLKPKVARTPMTTEQKLLMAAKAKATRIARGTLGPKQKAALKALTVPSTNMVLDNTGLHEAAPAVSQPASTGASSPTAPAVPVSTTPSAS
jgi:hypothetical protein